MPRQRRTAFIVVSETKKRMRCIVSVSSAFSVSLHEGSPGISVMVTQIWGCERAYARSTPKSGLFHGRGWRTFMKELDLFPQVLYGYAAAFGGYGQLTSTTVHGTLLLRFTQVSLHRDLEGDV